MHQHERCKCASMQSPIIEHFAKLYRFFLLVENRETSQYSFQLTEFAY